MFGTAFDGVRWKTVCFDSNMKPRWESPIGSQLFESLIDPIAPLRLLAETESQQANLAVATTQDAVHVFSSEGGWLADVEVRETPKGVALAELDGKICLLVSVGSVVECWELE